MRFRPIILAAALLLPVGAVSSASTDTAAAAAASSTATTVPAPEPEPVVTDNPFIPENANLGDCVSSLPRPDCGSEARGGAGQWLVLGALIAGLGFIGWRVSRGMRRARPTSER